MADNNTQDYVEYFLFPRLSNSNKAHKEALQDSVNLYVAHLSNYLVDYIWQNEPFKLTVADNGSPHLYGRTEFGDNIEDEWFIVYMLMDLSKTFPDLVVRVCDTDGEFLLIEASDHLKKWMKPESCEKRVYLYQGTVHILPVAETPGQLTSLPSGVPSLGDAVTAIREFSSTTKMEPSIQRAIQKRIGNYPNKIKENHHRAHCYIPAAVAAILQAKPSLLSAAVNAFYMRDPIDLKACCAMKYFPPETRVMTEVVFTRCLYAQILQQKYIPDKRVGWNLPPPNSPEFKSWDLGMKLACGFEILAAGARDCDGPYYVTSNTDLSADSGWTRYINSLLEKGFFAGELEHSVVYKELLAKAKSFYIDHILVKRENDRHTPGEEVISLLNTLEADVEQMRKNEKKLNPPDDDEWLNLSPDQLEAILKAYESRGDNDSKHSSQSNDKESVANTVASGLESFVSHVSSHEGAEFPKMRNTDKANKNNRITFDPDSFVDAMQSILDFKLPEWEGDDCSNSSGMSDYGDESDEMDLSKPAKSSKRLENGVSGMKDYMDQMDRELANTTVGQSFERSQKRGEPQAGASTSQNGVGEHHGDPDDDGYRPVDVDLTALKNILESYGSQQGLPGPASNLLESMGIPLPHNVDRLDC